MSQSTSSTTSRETSAELAARLRKILSAPEGGDVLAELARAGLVTRHDGLPVQDVIAAMPGRDLTAVMLDDAVAPAAGAIGRVDSRKSRATLTGARTLGMYVQDCLISTEASPAYRIEALRFSIPKSHDHLLHRPVEDAMHHPMRRDMGGGRRCLGAGAWADCGHWRDQHPEQT